MRLITFTNPNGEHQIGALIDEDTRVVNFEAVEYLNRSDPPDFLRNMLALIEGGDNALQVVKGYLRHPPEHACHDIGDVIVLAPLPVPTQIRCFSVFEQHAQQSGQAMMRYMASQSDNPEEALAAMKKSGKFDIPPVFYERPFYYKGNRLSVVGPNTDIHWPSYSNTVDYEIELAAVIGRKGRDISRDDARPYIFGYSVFNDLTARDEQSREMIAPLGPAKGKDFDGGNVLGPCIVTADELENPYELGMQAFINDECWTDSNSSEMTHDFEAMIAHVSRSETLYPGEIFLSGCAGGGCGLELEKYPERGDVIKLTIEKIGSFQNRIL